MEACFGWKSKFWVELSSLVGRGTSDVQCGRTSHGFLSPRRMLSRHLHLPDGRSDGGDLMNRGMDMVVSWSSVTSMSAGSAAAQGVPDTDLGNRVLPRAVMHTCAIAGTSGLDAVCRWAGMADGFIVRAPRRGCDDVVVSHASGHDGRSGNARGSSVATGCLA